MSNDIFLISLITHVCNRQTSTLRGCSQTLRVHYIYLIMLLVQYTGRKNILCTVYTEDRLLHG